MSYKYRQDCGCEFPINYEEILNIFPDRSVDESLKHFDSLNIIPPLEWDIEASPDCPIVWDMLGKGLTKGIFQLETPLGRQWTKKLKPTCIEHLGALGSILRPGCLRAVDENNISMTEHYCRRKNGEEEVPSYHPVYDEIVKKTYGALIYQEQALEIAKRIAGFTLQEADGLRKAIGKKLAEEMAKCEKMFIEGVARCKIVSIEQGAEIFEWIKKSQRYSFNKSHAISYGIDGYWSAYGKAHMPVEFFTASLRGAHEKQDPRKEMAELINEAKLMDIEVFTPDLRDLQRTFSTDGLVIKFGLQDIKGIGEAQVNKLIETVRESEISFSKKLNDWSWYEFLVHISGKLTENMMTRLISVGALRFLDKN